MTATRVLVPLAILEGESVSPGLTALLEPVAVTVLGYHVLPEQTPPDQARLQYEDRATDALDDLTATFRVGGGPADHRLVFTHDREQTIDRIAAETAADAYAIPGASGQIDRLLVVLTGDVAVDRICSFVGELIGPREIDVTLFLATDDADAGRALLETAAESIAAREIDVRTRLVDDAAPFESLLETATDHDAVVVGEQAPSLRSLVFGEPSERIAVESVAPVLVVRNVDETSSDQR
ncbi:universal stress protein [Natronolimnohabitans innermongolicus]|uniref:Amino acid permease-associated region n=1 Tax=Natronolimnohabitans innermongolicus JCM 12255 TaxID=1227499 RepID=L9WU37_9EURY|nr:universal stress protein [Natronolimnohabitans innermongolicus]ELY52979.1 amino acid permease-associated region [Natronolimnohabitans innermongolicus JCM 12255]